MSEPRKRVTVTMSPEVLEKVRRRATQEHRSVSNFLELLILRDAAKASTQAVEISTQG